jgi:YHS domain-containing protein
MKDPVCHKELDTKTILYTSIYKNKVYSFCSLTHKQTFDGNPEKYAKQEPAEEYCYTCSSGRRYGGPAFYLWLGLIVLLIVVLLLSLWFR